VRKTYRILADAIAVLVALQAMFMVFAIAGLFRWIDDGATLDAAVIESWQDDPPTFQGAVGHFLHVMVGTYLFPLIGLALLIIAFFTRFDGAIRWAAIILALIVLQVAAGIFAQDAPWLGLVHGLNAFALFSVAIVAARAAHPRSQTAMAVTP
jgi:hypothetical protein